MISIRLYIEGSY